MSFEHRYSRTVEKYDPIPGYMNEISGHILDAAIKVHSIMGKYLHESAYEESLTMELRKRGLRVERQKEIPLFYEEAKMTNMLRADILVEDCVIVEIKAIKELNEDCEGQLLTYMEKKNKRLGLLINFGGDRIKGNVRRLVK